MTTLCVTIGGGTFFDPCMRIISIQLDNGDIRVAFSTTNKVYGESTKGFTGISPDRGGFIATTEAEIFRFDNSFKIKNRITLPFLNDAHHIFWNHRDGRYYVANTGLDTVEVLNQEFGLEEVALLVSPRDYIRCIKHTRTRLRRYITGGTSKRCSLTLEDIRYKNLSDDIFLPSLQKALWHNRFRFQPKDFRYSLLRPHVVHPNHISQIQADLIVTLKNPGEIRSLWSNEVLVSDLAGPHDGFLRNGFFLITESGTGALKYARHISTVSDLKKASYESTAVCDPRQGFLRGVDMINDRFAVAAVSKRREISDSNPAWLAIIDLSRNQVVKTIDIPQHLGTNPFSVLALSD